MNFVFGCDVIHVWEKKVKKHRVQCLSAENTFHIGIRIKY